MSGIPVWPGYLPMDAGRYHDLADLVGEAVLVRHDVPVALPVATADLPADCDTVVYVVTNTSGFACYVGKFQRPNRRSGVAVERFREHLQEGSKLEDWREVWVIPLRSDTPGDKVLALESAVAARLGVPVRNRQARPRAARRARLAQV